MDQELGLSDLEEHQKSEETSCRCPLMCLNLDWFIVQCLVYIIIWLKFNGICSFSPALFHHLSHPFYVLLPIVHIHFCCLRICRRFRIRITQQTLYRCQNRRNIINRAPLILQNIEADISVVVNIWVVNLGLEGHFGRLVGIGLWKDHWELKCAALPICVFWAINDGLPFHKIVFMWRGSDPGVGWVTGEFFEITH